MKTINHSYTRSIITITLSILVLNTLPNPVHGANPSRQTLNFYGINGIYYYNPSGISDGCIIGTGSYDGLTSAGLYPYQASFVDTYHDIAVQLSIEYGIPWETVMAQGILESAAGTSNFAVNRNNFFGLGAYTTNPDNAFYYETPMAGWRGYYAVIANPKNPYIRHGAFTGQNITDPYVYLQTIKNAGYATSPTYVQDVGRVVSAVINRAQEKGWSTSAELAQSHPEMLTNAARYAAGGGGPTNNGYTNISYVNTTCVSSSVNISGSDDPSSSGTDMAAASGNGDINNSALTLAWPTKGVHTKFDPTQRYKQTLQQIGLWNEQSSIGQGASCDYFVSAVIAYSGIDPNFPQGGGVSTLVSYMNQSSLYEKVSVSSTSALQPGDILARGALAGSAHGHIGIYVQKSDGSFGFASASYDDRTGEIGSLSSIGSFSVYRFKGKSI